MGLFDSADFAEELGEVGETFLFGFFGEAGVHIGIFVVFAVGGELEVGGGVVDFVGVEGFVPEFGVFFFVGASLGEEFGYLLIAVFFGLGRVVFVFDASLGFASEGFAQVFFGFGTFEVGHFGSPISYLYFNMAW